MHDHGGVRASGNKYPISGNEACCHTREAVAPEDDLCHWGQCLLIALQLRAVGTMQALTGWQWNEERTFC